MADNVARVLFELYLANDSMYMCQTYVNFKCFIVCNRMLSNTNELNNTDNEEMLFQFCPREWEIELRNEMYTFRRTQSQFRLNLCLTYIRGESLHNIQYSTELAQFKRELNTGSRRINDILSNFFKENNLEIEMIQTDFVQ